MIRFPDLRLDGCTTFSSMTWIKDSGVVGFGTWLALFGSARVFCINSKTLMKIAGPKKVAFKLDSPRFLPIFIEFNIIFSATDWDELGLSITKSTSASFAWKHESLLHKSDFKFGELLAIELLWVWATSITACFPELSGISRLVAVSAFNSPPSPLYFHVGNHFHWWCTGCLCLRRGLRSNPSHGFALRSTCSSLKKPGT